MRRQQRDELPSQIEEKLHEVGRQPSFNRRIIQGLSKDLEVDAICTSLPCKPSLIRYFQRCVRKR